MPGILRRVAISLATSGTLAVGVLLPSSAAHADPELWKFYNRYGSSDACLDAGRMLEERHPHIWQWKCSQVALGSSAADLYYRGTI